jgi:hypothetical protein
MPDLSTDPALALSGEILADLRTWRTAHPRATLREIELEVDALLARWRAHLVQDTALTSAAVAWTALPPDQHPPCSSCGGPLEPRGLHPRTLRSHHDQPVTLTRQYGTCPHCDSGFFPPR